MATFDSSSSTGDQHVPIDPSTTSNAFTTPVAADRYTTYALAALRIIASYLFILHGCMKVFHVPHDAAYDSVTLLSLAGIAGLIELLGGVCVLIGWKTRPVAFLLSGEMAVAYFLVHASRGSVLMPMMNAGEPAVLYCFVFLLIAAAGSGALSLDGNR
jgi:putative oxidoreductase